MRLCGKLLFLVCFLLSLDTVIPAPFSATRIPYGESPEQFGDLRLPEGKGPFPVIVLIHGGCWLSGYDLTYLNPLADWFTTHGFATWSIEYRRLGNEGGGWPGTFLDVGHAIDALRKLSKDKPLDLNHVYTVGHSAGGQLALWLGSRSKLPKSSELYINDPLPIQGVLGLAAITDLEQYRIGPSGSCHASVDRLMGGGPKRNPIRYQQTSPLRQLPLGIPQYFIQGDSDPIVSLESVKTYVKASTKTGDLSALGILTNAGHFESASPSSASEPALLEALRFFRESTGNTNGKIPR